MKIIKLFERFIDEDKLEQFCKDNLAYLIDAGYSFTLDYMDDDVYDNATEITIFKKSNINNDVASFNLSEIIDDFIPFLLLLDKKWNLLKYASDEVVYFKHEDDDYYNYQSIDDLIYQNDNNIDIEEIRFIEIMVNGRKN